MSGPIGAGGPWMQTALRQFAADHPDTLAELEQRIPDGHRVSLICGSRPRPLGAVLRNGNDEVARVEPIYHSVGSAVSAVLSRVPSEVIVEDHGAFVVTADLERAS